jgi:hypothetical protein
VPFVVVSSPDPHCPDPVHVAIDAHPDGRIRVQSFTLPGERTTWIRKIDAGTVEVTTVHLDHVRGVSYDTIRGPIDLSSPLGWRSTGWGWSAIVADAIASLARTVWGGP